MPKMNPTILSSQEQEITEARKSPSAFMEYKRKHGKAPDVYTVREKKELADLKRKNDREMYESSLVETPQPSLTENQLYLLGFAKRRIAERKELDEEIEAADDRLDKIESIKRITYGCKNEARKDVGMYFTKLVKMAKDITVRLDGKELKLAELNLSVIKKLAMMEGTTSESKIVPVRKMLIEKLGVDIDYYKFESILLKPYRASIHKLNRSLTEKALDLFKDGTSLKEWTSQKRLESGQATFVEKHQTLMLKDLEEAVNENINDVLAGKTLPSDFHQPIQIPKFKQFIGGK